VRGLRVAMNASIGQAFSFENYLILFPNVAGSAPRPFQQWMRDFHFLKRDEDPLGHLRYADA
jgi:hypothetical protein